MSRAIVLLAEGFEEIEAVTLVDVLRRVGVEVVIAGLAADTSAVTASRGVRVVPDTTLAAALADAAARPFDAIVLPGGAGGAARLAEDVRVARLCSTQLAAGRFVAAICAAPTVLHSAGLLGARAFTSHPSVRAKLPAERYTEERVVIDGPLLTSRAPGTAFELALTLARLLLGDDARVARERDAMLVRT